MITNFHELLFAATLLFNALLFIPQAIKILRHKSAKEVSLFSFFCFSLLQEAAFIYGLIISDYSLVKIYLPGALVYSLIVILILYYKKNDAFFNKIGLYEILDQLPGHIYWKDKNGVCLGSNKNNWRDFGAKSLAEFVGKTDHDLFPKDEADKLRAADLEVIQSGEIKVFEEESTSGSEKLLYLFHKAPLRDKNNNIIGIIGTSIDITKTKHSSRDNRV